jgi:hypothetical protein
VNIEGNEVFMSWLKRLFGLEQSKNNQVNPTANNNTTTQTIPPERIGLNGEYDQSGLAKRVALAFDQDPQLNDIDTEELVFENNQPISFQYSENIMKEILTKDEMREVIGYEPLDKRKRRNKSIAEIVGGVGITNILAIVTNPALNDNQKINMLVLMYDIEIEDAEMIVLDKNMKVIVKFACLKLV